ncbi:flagellar type III secretion system protein FlhB [Paragemmobacter ruber]|uniref:Flagellar type III secretion system protein FlhB n=1 Tax=Paragemmobacter ruber TaxID=1985673 RepID=A0ABW9Y4Q5_9RHOB|nr:flagellar type III secretion system protein FlhB [Rhodobacter ruber]NBE07377.1 flagellar type III secretion system protein FlhB [Rhodobacter ruber]
MDEESDDKPYDPSEKRLSDLREKGQIPRSQDLLTAAAYAGFVLSAVFLGPGALLSMAETGMLFLARPEWGNAIGSSLAMVVAVLPIVLVPALPVVAGLVILRGIVFTPENLAPKLSRTDPLAAARQRFGPDGLVEFAKGAVKLVLVAGLLAWFLKGEADTLLTVPWLDPGQGSALMAGMLLQFLMLICALAAVLGLVDYLWQVYRHRQRNRMSRQELLDEHRETEGDPQARAARRQRGQDIAMNRMLADIPKADVIVVNPTHYAVALKWNRAKRQAPICLAKGVDQTAARIRDIAREHNIPIHSDPPTARALFATVEVGDQIRPDHYRAVAVAIRFAEAMRKKRARRWRS